MCIVVDAPVLELLPCVLERHELIDVQAFVAQPTVERFYVPVFRWFSGMREVELHTALIRPFLERFRRELRAVIHRDRHWGSGAIDDAIQGRDDVAAAEAEPRLNQRL